MNRILVIDDHAVVRGGIRQFLLDSMKGYIVCEASSGREALELVKNESWSLILLDIGLPDINGLEVLKRIKAIKADLKVLAFSMFDEDEFAMLAIEGGAAGYLPKDSAPKEILYAIERVVQGHRYLSDKLANKLLSGNVPAVKKLPHDLLSEREYEVMLRLSKGWSLVKIADEYNLSPKTVSTFRSRILRKIGVTNNSDITRYVLEHKLGN
jgi:DNA-binding NarL/FixJ family response regulator